MAPRFSARTDWNTSESALSASVRAVRESGRRVFDLTVSNPTVCGFDYDAEGILGALSKPGALVYDPDPRGVASARRAVSDYYAEHGAVLAIEDCMLTTSTSEAYSFLFRLLCNPGDEILVAQPGYPLFDFIAALDDVKLKHYTLFYDFGWWIDFDSLERQVAPRTRAVVLVHPNNPTGHPTSASQRDALEEFCQRHGLALIVDEVFLDYGLEEPVESFAVGDGRCLTFVVSGISKVCALPQMKVGWIACFGPKGERRGAMERLEVIADTYLSMNAPAQLALPAWLEGRHAIQGQIKERVRTNIALLGCDSRMTALPVLAGWSAIVRLPAHVAGLALEEDLVGEAGVIVHPGAFYGIPQGNRMVVSLLGLPGEFEAGLGAINYWCESKELTLGDRG